MARRTKRRMQACLFAGPSLYGHPGGHGVDRFPPATRGSIADAVRAGYTLIGFADGAVDTDEAVPLAELRDALARPGIQLYGAASMGAVRAAQLDDAGMQGIGRVYRLLRRGALTDADEVYLLHAPGALKYRPLTLPLVNIRYTLRKMRHSGELLPSQERDAFAYLLGVPWFDRDRNAVCAALYEACGGTRCADTVRAFERRYRDVKREDALCLLSLLQNRLSHALEAA